MKKLYKLLSLSVLAIAVTACGPGGNGLTVEQIKEAIEKPVIEKPPHPNYEVEVEVEKWNETITGTSTYIVGTNTYHSKTVELPAITAEDENGRNLNLYFFKKGIRHSALGSAQLIRNNEQATYGRWIIDGEVLVAWELDEGYKRLPFRSKALIKEMFIDLEIESHNFNEIDFDYAKRLVIEKIWTNAGGSLKNLPLNGYEAYNQVTSHPAWDINLEEEILGQE